MCENVKRISVFEILSQAWLCSKQKKDLFGIFTLLNFLYLLSFNFIDGGLSNKISILWVLAGYVMWCAFFRVYYGKKPYLISGDIFESLIPSTKMFFLVIISIKLFFGVLPYLPLLMGFDDKYLLLFEAYMQQLQEESINTLNMFVLFSILMLLFPFILCRPFLAFIASVQGFNGSLRKAWKKSVGNYWQFIAIVFLLNVPCVIIYEIDSYLGCNGYLSLSFYSVFFVYYNFVYAKLYDFFYTE